MPTLTIGPDGEITLPQDLLDHLGLSSGGEASVDLQPDGTMSLYAADTAPENDPALESGDS